MGTRPKHVMIIAGEASGDMRAAGLARALKQIDPSIHLSGVGGPNMRQATVACFNDITELAVIGIAEVIKNFYRIKKVFNQVLKEVDTTHPDAIVLVDYPGFNLRLAGTMKKRGIKIIYYISPQVWAWKESRVKKIKELVDRMMVILPFEQDTYNKYGMKVDYVGHPLVDEIMVNHTSDEVLKNLGLAVNKTTIGLMPGSRTKEVERHLPCMLKAAVKLYDHDQNKQFLLLKASSISLELLERHLETFRHLPLKIYDGPVYDGINTMDACLVASGTATLEAGLLCKPMVIIYKTSWLTYCLAKALIKIPYIGLVNIVAGQKIAEELIQNDAHADNIAKALQAALDNKTQIVHSLKQIKKSLGAPGASLRAAQIVLEEIN